MYGNLDIELPHYHNELIMTYNNLNLTSTTITVLALRQNKSSVFFPVLGLLLPRL